MYKVKQNNGMMFLTCIECGQSYIAFKFEKISPCSCSGIELENNLKYCFNMKEEPKVFLGRYLLYSDGRVWSKRYERFLIPHQKHIDSKQYYTLTIKTYCRKHYCTEKLKEIYSHL